MILNPDAYPKLFPLTTKPTSASFVAHVAEPKSDPAELPQEDEPPSELVLDVRTRLVSSNDAHPAYGRVRVPLAKPLSDLEPK